MSSATSTPVSPEIRSCSRSTLLFLAGAEGIRIGRALLFQSLAMKRGQQLAAADDVAMHGLAKIALARRGGQLWFRVERVERKRVAMRCVSGRAGSGIADVMVAVVCLARAVRQLWLRRNGLRQFARARWQRIQHPVHECAMSDESNRRIRV